MIVEMILKIIEYFDPLKVNIKATNKNAFALQVKAAPPENIAKKPETNASIPNLHLLMVQKHSHPSEAKNNSKAINAKIIL